MKKSLLKLSFGLFFAKIFAFAWLDAETAKPIYSKSIEIKSMLQGLKESLAVEVAIPDDFVCASRNSEKIDIDEGIFWGNRDTLNKYFAGELPLESCMIVVKTSNNVIQDGPHDFHADAAIVREWKVMGGRHLKIKKMFWGNYPLLVAECISHGGNQYYLAWVGLNDPSGKTLMFTFLCPHSQNCPTDAELAIWYHFLLNSREMVKSRIEAQANYSLN